MKNILHRPAIWAGLLGLATLLGASRPAPTVPTAPAAPRSRRFVLTSTATVPVPPAGTKTLDLWLPVPHTDASQRVAGLKISAPLPYKIEKGPYGNLMLHLRPVTLPTVPLTVTVTAEITRREHLNLRAAPVAPVAGRAAGATAAAGKSAPNSKADPDMARWLGPDKLVPLDPQIRQQAAEVVAQAGAKTDLEKARAIYEHVVGTVKYDKTGQGWGRGDIYYACDARRGNCTDFHAIIIGYCRAVGIPARFSIGLPLPAGRGQGEIKGYHCWAEFFTPQTGWVPVDASEAAKDPARRNYFFGAHDENRVEFSRGRDVVLIPAQAGPPLNYFVYPYAEADGQPLEVGRQYFFQDQNMPASHTPIPAPATAPAAPAPAVPVVPAAASKPSGQVPAPAGARLLFVYNADAGILNGFKDMVHKAVSPETYSCALCAITYDFTGMRKDWKQALQALPLPSEFLHRDEFIKAHPDRRQEALPAAFRADAAGQLTPFITAAEMKTLTLDGLIALVQQRAAAEQGK